MVLPRLACLLLLAIVPVVAAATEPVAVYTVRHAGGDVFDVEARFAVPTRRLDLNSHEASGRPDSQAASVRELQAFDATGAPTPILFQGKGTWTLAQAPAARIRYRLAADHDGARWIAGKDEVATKFDRSYFFAGDAFFLLDYDWPKRPVTVKFDLPAGWQVTSPWRGAGGELTAPDADHLGTNVFAMGMDAARRARVGDTELTWLADARVAAIDARLVPMFDALPAVYGRFWGDAPDRPLTVFFLSDPETDGGAFLDSFALRLATPLRPSEAIVWEHTLAHELMHVWMNNGGDGIRLADSTGYWFTEGFTDYLTVKLMREAGLLDEALGNQRLANQLRRYQLGKRLSTGVTLMSAGKEKHKHWELIYGGGATLALLLDAELSRESPTAFRDAVRAVQHQGDGRLDGAAILAVLDARTNGRASKLMAELDKGLTLPDFRARLEPAGYRVEGFASDEVYVTTPAPAH
jgi:predicted metalloprotease with PDZ domain